MPFCVASMFESGDGQNSIMELVGQSSFTEHQVHLTLTTKPRGADQPQGVWDHGEGLRGVELHDL